MKPSKPEHYIGKTRLIATALFNKVPTLQACNGTDPVDRSFLFTGPAGTGKSSLAQAFALALSGNKLAIEQVNGQSCSVEVIRRWQEEGWYLPLYGKLWVKIIDEVDAMSNAAAGQARTWLDQLSPHTVVVATTNVPVDELQEQLQSRFKIQFFAPVPAPELANWLATNYRLALDKTQRIAEQTRGNVRAAKADCLSLVEMQEALATA